LPAAARPPSIIAVFSAQQSGSGFSFNGIATYVEIADDAEACGVEGAGEGISDRATTCCRGRSANRTLQC